MSYKLLTENQPKMEKAREYGYYNVILHLLPAKLSGFNVCPSSTPECRALCLNEAGHAGIYKKGTKTNKIQEARRRRTLYYFNDRKNFELDLYSDIEKAQKKAEKLGLKLCVRLQGTSDIISMSVKAAQKFPKIQFVEYTKNIKKIANMQIPENLCYTVSRSETNENEAFSVIDRFNVAVIFNSKELPKKYRGYEVIDGDKSDIRSLDKRGVVVGLRVKGNKARKSNSSFFVTL
jgi:hypothetical protein